MSQRTLTTRHAAMSLLDTAAWVEKRLDQALAHTRGTSMTEYRILRALADTPRGTASRVDLARAVGLTPSAVTRALKPMEKQGYLESGPSDRDARQTLAGLTDAGRELLADAEDAIDTGLHSLGVPTELWSAVTQLLDRMVGWQ